jgi:Uma2 family endonuclease
MTSQKKFPFYAQASIREIWLMEPETREHQVHSPVTIATCRSSD